MEKEKNFRIVGVFGYNSKNKYGELIQTIKTDLTEDKLNIYYKKKYPQYKTFSFAYEGKPDFKRCLNI